MLLSSAEVGSGGRNKYDLIACIGMANGAVIVDGYSALVDNALHLTHIAEGDIHPTDAGYAAIAHAFMNAEKGR